MGALQVLVFVTSVVLVLENGSLMVTAAPSGTYSITTVHRSSSPDNSIAPTVSKPGTPVSPSGSYGRGDLSTTDYRRYLPVEDTPEVKEAREQFFRLYEKQARLAAVAPDNDLDGTNTRTRSMTKTGEDEDYADYYNYYDSEGDDEEEEEEGDGSEEEGEEGSEEEEEGGEGSEEEEGDDDDSEEDEDDVDSDEGSEEGEDSSSSSEEDYDGVDSSSSSEEDYDGVDSSEEGEDSSSEESLEDSEDSSSSSEEDDETGAALSLWNTQPLRTNSIVAPKPVTDTPEVQHAKRKFFKLYKAQAELSFNAPDDH